jgi:hypothetical protein
MAEGDSIGRAARRSLAISAFPGRSLGTRGALNMTKPRAATKALPGAYGHKYDLKADDKARFWLMKSKDNWSVIDNSDGVEKLKK